MGRLLRIGKPATEALRSLSIPGNTRYGTAPETSDPGPILRTSVETNWSGFFSLGCSPHSAGPQDALQDLLWRAEGGVMMSYPAFWPVAASVSLQFYFETSKYFGFQCRRLHLKSVQLNVTRVQSR